MWSQDDGKTGAENAAFYRTVYEQISDCLFVLEATPDQRFKVLGFNPAEERAVGLKNSEVSGRFIEEILPPELAADVTAKYRTCATEGRIIRYDEVLDLPKGRTAFHTVLVPVRGPDGRTSGIIGVARDITEARRTSESQALRQLILSTQSETSPDGILVVDADGRMISFNQRFVAMWGIPDEVLATGSELLGLQWAIGRVREPEAFLARVMELNAHRDQRSRDEIALRDGRVFVRHSAPMLGPEGDYFGRVWYFRDVTEQKHSELQLRQSQKMEAVGSFAGGIAHDFNNLLTAMLSSANALDAELPPGSPLAEDARTIVDAARRGAELTRKLLGFSRRQPLELRRQALGSLVQEFARMAQRVVPADVDVSVHVETPAPTLIDADAGAVEQILMNLVTNARDAMPNGGALRIDVDRLDLTESLRPLPPGSRAEAYVRMTVRDTGVGMDPATVARVFEPFFTTKPPGRGTGLGMASVYGLTKQHGGFVEVASVPGAGTTVRICFPAVAGDIPGSEDAPLPVSLPHGSETLLLVEDNPSVRRVTARVLERAGYRVLTAGNGCEALDLILAGRDRTDLVISDVVMPEMGGPELIRRIATLRGPQRVLFTSGYAQAELAERPALAPEIPFLPKPWEVGELLRKVRATLDAPPPRLPLT
jgi:PAS domain S-box-containing protein